MSDAPTPRTDAYIEKIRDNWWQTDITIPFSESNFEEMKEMERELLAAKVEVWRLRDEIARLRDELCIAQEDSK